MRVESRVSRADFVWALLLCALGVSRWVFGLVAVLFQRKGPE